MKGQYLFATAVLLTLGSEVGAQTRIFCLDGSLFTCVGVGLETSHVGGETEVLVRLSNLQGQSVLGTGSQVDWSRFHLLELVARLPEFQGGFITSPLDDPTLTGPVEVFGDTREKWLIYNIGEDGGAYVGYAIDTNVNTYGADIIGCDVPPNQAYPYYRTCSPDGTPAELVLRFTTEGSWSAEQMGLLIGVHDPFGENMGCMVAGTLYDDPEAYHCLEIGGSDPALLPQIITLDPIDNRFRGDSPFELSAVGGGSGNPVVFTSLTTSVCTVYETTVSILDVGTCTIAANQDGDAYYEPAEEVLRSFLVQFDFDGFLSPIANPPLLNLVKPGRAIPVKFGLGGDWGLDIFDGGVAPRSDVVACDATNFGEPVDETVTAGSSTLAFDPETGQYAYVWKTEKSWTGCRQLAMRLRGGQVYRALFKFGN